MSLQKLHLKMKTIVKSAREYVSSLIVENFALLDEIKLELFESYFFMFILLLKGGMIESESSLPHP